MARLNAPRSAGDRKPSSRTDPTLQDPAGETPNSGWPFAEGSQNHLDEAAAPWPRPSSKSALTPSPRQGQPK